MCACVNNQRRLVAIAAAADFKERWREARQIVTGDDAIHNVKVNLQSACARAVVLAPCYM
jgi:hypothetical protein